MDLDTASEAFERQLTAYLRDRDYAITTNEQIAYYRRMEDAAMVRRGEVLLLRAEVAKVRIRAEHVRALHIEALGGWCAECASARYPCPTVRALDGEA